MELDRLWRGLVDAGVALTLDAESVDSVEDYRTVLAELSTLTGGSLRIDGITVEDTDYIDAGSLLAMLNAVLRSGSDERRLWHVWDARLFGQDFGVVFATRDERDRLYRAGLSIAVDEEGRLPLLPADGKLGGHPAVGFDEENVDLDDLAMRLTGLVQEAVPIARLEIDSVREQLRAHLRDGRMLSVATANDDFGCSLADGGGFATVVALNRVLATLGEHRELVPLRAERDTWRVVFVTPEEGDRLDDE